MSDEITFACGLIYILVGVLLGWMFGCTRSRVTEWKLKHHTLVLTCTCEELRTRNELLKQQLACVLEQSSGVVS